MSELKIQNHQTRNILWVGNDYRSKTGYGRLTRELFHFLKNDFHIIHFSIGSIGSSNEYNIIDSSDETSQFGFIKLPRIINLLKPDVIILLNTSEIINGWLSSIQQSCTHKSVILPYICNEYAGFNGGEADLYNLITNGIITMAQNTSDEITNRGYFFNTLKLSHSHFDNILKIDKKIAKTLLGIRPDTFVFFSGGKNHPKNRLDIIIRSFVHFLKNNINNDVLLMMNCNDIDIGWDLKYLYTRLCREQNIQNMEKYICFCAKNNSLKNDDELSVIYAACDVGITVSPSKSFCLTPFEHSAFGVPQIIPNWGGLGESMNYGCIKIDPSDYYVYPFSIQKLNGEIRTLYYKYVSDAMEKYYTDRTFYETHSVEVKKNIEICNWQSNYCRLLIFINKTIEYVNKPNIIKQLHIRDKPFLMNLYNDGDLISNTINKTGVWEPIITKRFLNIMNDNKNDAAIIVDVGANIGYYSLLSASNGYEVHAFEPDNNNYTKFTDSISINNFNKIHLHNRAVSNKSNERLFLNRVPGPIVNHGCLSLIDMNINNKSEENVCLTVKLDDIIQADKEILILKIDVEGFEPEVIEGSKQLLENGRILNIFIEITTKFRNKNDYMRMVFSLMKYGYTKITNLIREEIISFDILLEELHNLPSGQCDYLFTKTNIHSDIPMNIFQTWHNKDLSIEMNENINQMQQQHPNFKYRLYDTDDCREFIKDNFEQEVLETYDDLIPYAYKSDLWRLCILYIYGGVYLDIKYKLLNNFNLTVLMNKEYFVLDREGHSMPNKYTIQNGFIISKPGNKILLDCINQIVLNVKNNFYGFSSLYPTGPGLVGEICQKYNMIKNDFVLHHSDDGYKILYKSFEILTAYNNYYNIDNTKQRRHGLLWSHNNIYRKHKSVYSISANQKVQAADLNIKCLNLPTDIDRKRHMQYELACTGCSYSFVDAIVGKDIDFRSNEYKNIFSEFAINKIYSDNKEHGHDMTSGGAGLILSTLELWKKVDSPTLVIEDDIVFEKGFDIKLKDILNELPEDWDILYLGYYHDPRINQVSPNIWSAERVYGLYGYIINNKYINKILAGIYPFTFQIDTEINNFNKNSKTYIVYPPIIHHPNLFNTHIQIFDHPLNTNYVPEIVKQLGLERAGDNV